ncbi:MAG TPA: hypothetical protein VKC65_02010 [Gaiellaceae bacterium]|nr:hypothetical protein [Gaiellaceae bacterium]
MAPLVELRAYFLLILPVRLVLGLLGLAAARALGVTPSAAIWLFALGAVFFGLAMLTSRRRQSFFERASSAQEIDAQRTVESRARTLARSAYPSTIAVSALTLIALPINAALAALLAGLLAGMAIVGAVFGVELVQWEQSRGVRLFALPGPGRELFVRPAG